MMGAAGRIDTRETHRGGGEPVDPNPRGKSLLIRNIGYPLSRYGDLMTALSERIREVENVAFLAADIWRKKLGQQKDAHQWTALLNGEVTVLAQSRDVDGHYGSVRGGGL